MIPGLSGIEFLAIFIVAVLIIPPKDFPKVAAQAGRMWVKLKYQMSNMRSQFDRAIAEAELEEIKQASQNFSEHMEPLKDIQSSAKKHINRAISSEEIDMAKEWEEATEEAVEEIKKIKDSLDES